MREGGDVLLILTRASVLSHIVSLVTAMVKNIDPTQTLDKISAVCSAYIRSGFSIAAPAGLFGFWYRIDVSLDAFSKHRMSVERDVCWRPLSFVITVRDLC